MSRAPTWLAAAALSGLVACSGISDACHDPDCDVIGLSWSEPALALCLWGQICSCDPVAGTAVLHFAPCTYAGLSSLEGTWGQFVGLVTVDFTGNELVSLAPLVDVRGLIGIIAAENRVTDLTTVPNIQSLVSLDLSSNALEDLGPLSTAAMMQGLKAEDNLIADLTPLSSALLLGTLQLGGNRIDDLTPLAGLPDLQFLDVTNNQVADISEFARTFDCQGPQQATVIRLAGNPLDSGDNADIQVLINKGCQVQPSSF